MRNADGLLGANGDILSGNLFAYCSNDPVHMVDFGGNMAGVAGVVTVTGTIGAANSWNPLGWIALGAAATCGVCLLIYWADSATVAVPQVYEKRASKRGACECPQGDRAGDGAGGSDRQH